MWSNLETALSIAKWKYVPIGRISGTINGSLQGVVKAVSLASRSRVIRTGNAARVVKHRLLIKQRSLIECLEYCHVLESHLNTKTVG